MRLKSPFRLKPAERPDSLGPGFGRRSLVGRLISLASIWSLLLLAAMGLSLIHI